MTYVVPIFNTQTRATESGEASDYDSRKDWLFDTGFALLCIAGGLAAVLSSCAKVLLAKDMLLHAVKKEAAAEVAALKEQDKEGSSSNSTSPSPEQNSVELEQEHQDAGIVTVATGEDEGEEAKEDEEQEQSEFQHRYDVGLAKANRTFSFIDLSMAVVAPILVGLICDSVFWKSDGTAAPAAAPSSSTSSSPSLVASSSEAQSNNGLLMNTMWAAVFVGAWNLVSCVPETLIPNAVATKYQLAELFVPQNADKPPSEKKSACGKAAALFVSFRELFQQSSILALFSFAMLWCTILTPSSSPLVAYLVGTRSFSSLAVSLFAALSQVIGTLGLAVPPLLIKRRWAPSSVAMLGFVVQALLLTACVVSFCVDYAESSARDSALAAIASSSSNSSSSGSTGLALLYVAMAAIALSRFGLWMGDNAMQLILQKTVPLKQVSSVNGALQALYSFWSAIALIVSIFTPVSLFLVAVGFSYAVVVISIGIYSIYFCKNPKMSHSQVSISL